MQQTILAIGALLIIMTTAMLQQRSSMLTQELAYIRQIEIAAEDAARMRLEGITTLAFDENLVGLPGLPTNPIAILEPPGNFGLDANDLGIADDIDDFHGVRDSIWHTVSSDSLRFVIEYSVGYLDTVGDSSAIPTETKEIEIMIESLTSIGNRQVVGVFATTTLINDNFP